MKIKIHNVGKLADATVEIDGITVIAGENDTGKSSVSKALYSVFFRSIILTKVSILKES